MKRAQGTKIQVIDVTCPYVHWTNPMKNSKKVNNLRKKWKINLSTTIKTFRVSRIRKAHQNQLIPYEFTFFSRWAADDAVPKNESPGATPNLVKQANTFRRQQARKTYECLEAAHLGANSSAMTIKLVSRCLKRYSKCRTQIFSFLWNSFNSAGKNTKSISPIYAYTIRPPSQSASIGGSASSGKKGNLPIFQSLVFLNFKIYRYFQRAP